MPSLILRRATLADAVSLADLGDRAFRDTFAADNDPADLSAYLDETFSPNLQAAELADPAITAYLAELDGATAGYTLLVDGHEPPADVARVAPGLRLIEVNRLYVDQKFIGTGIGAVLMTHLLEHARSVGAAGVWLGVWERNPRAIRFYERFGFVDVGAHLFVVGTDPQTDRLMLHRF